MRFSSLIVMLLIVANFCACRKKEDPTPTPANDSTGTMTFQISNVVGNKALTLNTEWYQNANLDSYQVSVYKYYISNIVLQTASGKNYMPDIDYYLIDQSKESSRSFKLENVPNDTYTGVSFLIGVDALANTSGAQLGALNPSNGMIWDWNTGYIMAKMEGNSPQSGGGGSLAFHIAGFSGPLSALHNTTLTFPSSAVVTATKTPNIHIVNDLNEWFVNPTKISFKGYNTITTIGTDSKTIADNYADMFKVDHVD